jgi:hypothetical protein
MLTYADVCRTSRSSSPSTSRSCLRLPSLPSRFVCSRMLTYAHVCSRMLTYGDVCSIRDMVSEAAELAKQLRMPRLSILLHMCPHNTMCPHTTACVLILLYMCQMGVKVFTADIIYHLFDAFTRHMNEKKKEKRAALSSKGVAVFPVVLSIIPVSVPMLCSRMLTYAHVCSRTLTYAHVCRATCTTRRTPSSLASMSSRAPSRCACV